MADLTEQSFLDFYASLWSGNAPFSVKPSQLIVSEEVLEYMKGLCADDPEFRKRVLAEFPQLEGII